MALVVAIAGKIGSGKTTITKSLAKDLDWPRVSFGDYVRAASIARGIQQTRANLQELGTQLLRSDPREFCRRVLETARWKPGESLVIDGLRHAETIPVLRELVAPAAFKIVLISVSDDIRLRRLKERGEGDEGTIAAIEEHSSERQVASILHHLVDLVVSGEKARDEIISELKSWIRNQQCHC